MLNMFQHLIKSTCSEILKRVQGDQKILLQRSLKINVRFLLEKTKNITDNLWNIMSKNVTYLPDS